MIAPTLLCLAAPLQGLLGVADDPQACTQNPANTAVPSEVIDNPTGTAETLFGFAVVVLDFDGDGEQDLAVGAPGADPSIAGEVFVYFGPRVWTKTPIAFQPTQSAPGDKFGHELVAIDLDGVGGEELVVGSPRADVAGLSDAGRISIWSWDAGTTSAIQRLELVSNSVHFAADAALGHSIVTGDFLPDPGIEIAASAPYAPQPGIVGSFGAVHIFANLRSTPTELAIANPNPQPHPAVAHDYNQFGTDLACGDWNRDGKQDLVVGAIYNDVVLAGVPYGAAGQVYVYTAPLNAANYDVIDNPDPSYDPPALPTFNPCSYQRFGQVVGMGDVDGDGFAEVAVGSSRKNFPNPCGLADECDLGKGFLFSRRSHDYRRPRTSFEHPRPLCCDLTTYRLNFADLIGDSRPDLIVGTLIADSVNGPCGSPPSTPLNTECMLIWDAASLRAQGRSAGPPDRILYMPPDAGPHFCRHITAGDLDSGQGKLDLVLGDDDYSAPGQHFVGRVLITFWP